VAFNQEGANDVYMLDEVGVPFSTYLDRKYHKNICIFEVQTM